MFVELRKIFKLSTAIVSEHFYHNGNELLRMSAENYDRTMLIKCKNYALQNQLSVRLLFVDGSPLQSFGVGQTLL